MDTPLRGQSLDLSTPSTVIHMDPDDTPIFQHRPVQTYSRANRSSPNISDKVTLRKFSGFSSENGKNFLLEFESFCTYQNLNSDDRKVAAFHLHLSGPALIWFNALEVETKLTWFALKGAFTAQYAMHGMFDPDLVAESAVFESLKLDDAQPLEDFHSKIMDKGCRLQKPERDLITKFINELPQQLAFFVRTASVKSFKDALQHAKLGEAYGYRTITTPRTPTVAAVKVGPSEEQNEQIFHMLRTITDRLDKLESSTSRPTDRSERDVRTCHACNGTGHFKRACNWTGHGPRKSQAKCQICSQIGHIAAECRLFTAEKARRNPEPKNGQRPG